MSAPTLPFSKLRRVGSTIYLSGEMGILPDGSVPDGIEAQTEVTLRRIEATLATEGLSLADVVSCTCYLADKADFAAFNAVYRRMFADPLPVRSTVEAQLMIAAKVEITVIAEAR